MYAVGIPKMDLGDYTMQVALDTKSPLGILCSKRKVTIGQDKHELMLANRGMLIDNYFKAVKSKDKAAAAKAMWAFADGAFDKRIKPGKPCILSGQDQAINDKYPGSDQLAGEVRFYPEASYLRVVADVTDANFSTDAPEEKEWRASSVEVYLSATGFNDDVVQFFIVPKGTPSAPGIRAVREATLPRDVSGVIGSWARTPKGYFLTVQIPYTMLPDYDKERGFLTAEVSINSKTPDGGTTLRLNGGEDPPHSTVGYAVLPL